LRIILITDQPKDTGIGRYTWSLAESLSKVGNQVSILYNGYFDPHCDDSNIELISLDSLKKAKNSLSVPLVRKYNSLRLKAYSKDAKDSVVHFCGTDYSGLKYFTNTIATIHDLRFDFLLNSLSKSGVRNTIDSIYRDLNNLKTIKDVKSAARLISISKVTQVQLTRNGLNSQVIHHWINTKEFKLRDKSLTRKTLSLPSDMKLILNVSSGTKNKRIKYLENVCDFLPDGYRMIKIGTPLRSRNAINIGKVANDIYPLYFNAADLYLNVSSFEGFGRPQMEAIGSDLPVLATNIPINREVLGKAAMCFDVSMKPGDLAEYIKEVLTLKIDATYVENMKKQRLELDEDKAIAAYLELYNSVLHVIEQ